MFGEAISPTFDGQISGGVARDHGKPCVRGLPDQPERVSVVAKGDSQNERNLQIKPRKRLVREKPDW